MDDFPELIGFAGRFLQFYEDRNESSWSKLIRAIFPSAVIVADKKFPDVSFYQGAIDFTKMKNMTNALIIRAGQNTWIDSQFARNYSTAKSLGMVRGVYWFYDDRISPDAQAAILINLLKNDLPEMEVFADWENSYGGAYGGLKNVVRFMQAVAAALPTVKLGLYTGYYWFKDHSNATTNAAEYAYLADKALWLAWYTSNPSYVLIPPPWTKLTHWQYGTPAIGSTYGVQTGNIDMNFFNGTSAEFADKYGGGGPPPNLGDELLTAQKFFDGGVYSKWMAHTTHGDIDYHIFEAEVSKIDFYVNAPRPARTYVPRMLNEYGLDFAVNGDGFVSVTPQGISYSNGVKYAGLRYEETAYYSHNGAVTLNSAPDPWMAISFPNVLVENGIKRAICDERVDMDPRTASGVSADGTKYAFLVVDGREYVGDGFTYHETADRLIKVLGPGANIFMHDGGGSSTMTVKYNNAPLVLNDPCGEEFIDGLWMRPVANILGIKQKAGTTPMRYNAVSSTNAMSLRKEHTVNAAGVKLTTVPVGTTVYGDVIWTAPADGVNVKKGDIWLQTSYGGYSGWVAIVHMGVTYMVLTDTGSVPPTTVPFSFILSVEGYKPVTITGLLEKA